MTSGFDVFVQEVIAAKTIEPWLRACSYPLYLKLCLRFAFSAGIPKPLNPTLFEIHFSKSFLTSETGTLS